MFIVAGFVGAAGASPIMVDLTELEAVRDAYRAGAPGTTAAVEALLEQAESALGAGPFSVTFKAETPPSGDKRDYMSQGPYWWPDPDKEDGLPYIRRDGERNPETDALDRRPMGRMASAVNTLSLAYFYSGNEAYAAVAARLLRTWFLSPETGMNPHLEYGQRIPGRTEGRGIGIIDTRSLMPLGDASFMLLPSDAWTENDHEALREWFRAYLAWLLESDHGKNEKGQHNNHGTWYDAQVAAYALFVGDDERARRSVDVTARGRIPKHIEPDGRQPHELARTLPSGYSMGNLEGFVDLATIGRRVGVDLWQYETEDGRGIRRALDYLVPYASGDMEWEYRDLRAPAWERMTSVLRRAAIAYDHAEYETLLQDILGEDAPRHRVNLLYPAK